MYTLPCFFLLILCSSLFGADTQIYYRHPLTLTLLRHGEDQFLLSCRDLPAQEYRDALEDVIDLFFKNSTNIPMLLQNLKDTLYSKVKRIKRLKIETVDWDDVLSGTPYLGAGSALTCGIYYIYKGHHNNLSESSQENLTMCLLGGACIAAYLFGLGVVNTWHGLYPYREDQYLEHYNNLLQITHELIKEHSEKNTIKKRTGQTC